MDFFHAQRTTLPDNFGSEIDFVMWRTNTRAELHDHVRGIGSEVINHLPDRVRDDAELGAFASGMHETDRGRFWIDNVNCAAVSDVNTRCDTALVGNDAVAAGEFAAHRATAATIYNCDFVPVNLFSSEQRPVSNTDCIANFAMGGAEPRQDFSFIV